MGSKLYAHELYSHTQSSYRKARRYVKRTKAKLERREGKAIVARSIG